MPLLCLFFQEVFSWLPIAHCINSSVLVMHGGLSQDGVKLDDIRAIQRGTQPENNTIMCDLMWADPQVRIKIEEILTNIRQFTYLIGRR